MDECYTDLIGDFEEANQPDEPCPVCGAQTYTLQSGFYYCTICSTQSQVAQLFVEEEEFGTLFTPFRQRIAVEREAAVSTPTRKKGNKVTTITSWEVHNLVLKQIADRLVSLGFPADVKPRILELWCSYLKRRGVISGSTDGEATTSVTRREPRQNLIALFGVESKRRKIRKNNRVSEKPNEEPESDYDPSNPGTPRKQKRRLKAFQNHYAELETAGVGMNASDSESMYHFDNADVRDLQNNDSRACSSMPKTRISKEIFSEGFNAAKQSVSGRSNILRSEEFTLSSALQIAYAGLRLAGCPVLLTDIVRLHHQGAFELEKVKDVLTDQNESLSMYTFMFLKGGNELAPLRFASSMDNLCRYITVELEGPVIEDYIPKLMDDLKLPREFEYFLKKFLCLVPADVLSKKSSVNRHFVDLKIFSVVCVLLRLLFGFDDLTEKYQAKFAQAVNKVIVESINAFHEESSEKAEWSLLFDMEEWSKFWNCRYNFVNSAFSSRKGRHCRKTYFSDAYCMARDSLLETLGNGDHDHSSPEAEESSSQKVSLSLPFEEISHSYLQSGASVNDGVKRILLSDFLKKRIDFIYQPEKYVRLLEKAGYRVYVFSGTARDYELSSFDETDILLFQPYKKFKNSFSLTHACINLKSLIEQFCSVSSAGFLQDGILDLFEEFTHSFSDATALACLNGSIPFF